MDLTAIDAVRVARTRADAALAPGEAALAGGTWLYSDAEPGARVLVDLTALGWPPVEADGDGLTIAATCTIAHLAGLDPVPGWASQHLVASCARALAASEKIWAAATVGGNVCTALPAGAMISLLTALEAAAVVWTPDGGERTLPVADLVTGDRTTALAPGEVLRALRLPGAALRSRAVFRRVSLAPQGRSGAVVIGRAGEDGFAVSVTAGVARPRVLRFGAVPDAASLAAAVEAIDDWFDDVHGAPDWRRAMTLRLAEQVRAELAGGTPPPATPPAPPPATTTPEPAA